MVKIFRQEIRPGNVVFDIGANEGFYSALAASIVGPDGIVVAVEPQSRLYEFVNINLALNATGMFNVYMAAISDNTGEKVELSLTPLLNTGASSIVRSYRWSTATELVDTFSIDDIFERENLEVIDFIKIDVEGFEFEVINSMEKLFMNKSVKCIFIDYHDRILRDRGLSARHIHDLILTAGFRLTPDNQAGIEDNENGYARYRLSG